MQPHALERQQMERQATLARPVAVALTLVVLFEMGDLARRPALRILLLTYLLAALIVVLASLRDRGAQLRIPLWVDIVAVAALLWLTPSLVAFWFPFLFVVHAAGMIWDERRALIIAGAATLAVMVKAFLDVDIGPRAVAWLPLSGITFISGAATTALASYQRRQAAEHDFLARLSSMLQVDLGLGESLRNLLAELAGAFECEEALLVFQESELERIFVWRVRPGETNRIVPETLPLAKGDAFLLDQPRATVGWNSLEEGDGFGWDRHTGEQLDDVPRVPGPARKEMHLRSLLTVTFDFANEPAGRLLLLNRDGRFTPRDLRRLERIVRQLAPQLKNVYWLRHVRARAIEAERGRLSRDLHDGILQSLLSFQIQLDVLRRRLPESAEQVALELAALGKTLKNETEELRRVVTDMRPLRVQSADLVDLMHGFAERFRNESKVALDLLVDSAQLQAPDRICRELFQIYREALHNIKKHAGATHVVVKLWQEGERLFLVVDDNGQGFSFAGRFTSDELDRLRLGPISIKERTRSVGGVLTVESNPGHGARLTVEVPLA
jgi:signal transduction histidine kinase